MTEDLQAQVDDAQRLMDEIRFELYDDGSDYDKAFTYRGLLMECLAALRKAYKGAVK